MKRTLRELMKEARKNRDQASQRKPPPAKNGKRGDQATGNGNDESGAFLKQQAGGQSYYCVLCGPTAVMKSRDMWTAHVLTKRHKESRTEYVRMAAQMQEQRGAQESEIKEEKNNNKNDEKEGEKKASVPEEAQQAMAAPERERQDSSRDPNESSEIENALPKGFFDDASEEAKARAGLMSEEDRRLKEEEEKKATEAKRAEQARAEVKENMMTAEAEEEENEIEEREVLTSGNANGTERENEKKAATLAELMKRLAGSRSSDTKNKINGKKELQENENATKGQDEEDSGIDDDDDLGIDWMAKGVCEKREKRTIF